MCERWFEEVGDASFTPAINEYDPVKTNKQHLYIEGLAKYLEKQALAQRYRDELEEKERKVFCTGSKWTPRLTEPETPKFQYVAKVERQPYE